MAARLPSSANLALVVGALGSGAAQVAWNFPRGPVHVVAGVFATLLVPVGVHLFPKIAVTGRPTRILRALVMTYICAAAAAVNLWHAVQLLTHGTGSGPGGPPVEEWWSAGLLVTAIEATMVMASLARRKPPEKEAAVEDPAVRVALLAALSMVLRAQPAAPVRKQAPPRPRPKPQPPAEPRRRVAGTQLKVPAREWAEKQVAAGRSNPTGAEIMLATGAAKAYAYRIAKDLREGEEAVS